MKIKTSMAALATAVALLFVSPAPGAQAYYYVDTQDAGYGVLYEMPEGWTVDTQIRKDGTIVTESAQTAFSFGKQYELALTEDTITFYEYSNDYAIQVTPTDPEAFVAAVENTYTIVALENGDYVLCSDEQDGNFFLPVGGECGSYQSYWRYDEAKNIAQDMLHAGLIQSATLLQGYYAYDYDYVAYTIRIFSTETVTEQDFAGLGDDWEIDLDRFNGVTVTYQIHDLIESRVEGVEAALRQFFTYCLTQVDGVYAVTLDPWYFAYDSNNMQYAPGEVLTMDSVDPEPPIATDTTTPTDPDPEPPIATDTTTLFTGDLDGDGAITIQDAYQTLMAYANASAGLEDGLTETQRLAADVDGDGEITLQDAYRILCYYADTAAGLTPSWT